MFVSADAEALVKASQGLSGQVRALELAVYRLQLVSTWPASRWCICADALETLIYCSLAS